MSRKSRVQWARHCARETMPHLSRAGLPDCNRPVVRATIPAPRELDREAIELSLQHWKLEASVALGHIADLERLARELDQ